MEILMEVNNFYYASSKLIKDNDEDFSVIYSDFDAYGNKIGYTLLYDLQNLKDKIILSQLSDEQLLLIKKNLDEILIEKGLL